jgi:hypothetical protein
MSNVPELSSGHITPEVECLGGLLDEAPNWDEPEVPDSDAKPEFAAARPEKRRRRRRLEDGRP